MGERLHIGLELDEREKTGVENENAGHPRTPCYELLHTAIPYQYYGVTFKRDLPSFFLFFFFSSSSLPLKSTGGSALLGSAGCGQ